MIVKYVKSENNVSDICTKNLPSKPFEKHSKELFSDVGFFVRCDKTKFPPKKKSRGGDQEQIGKLDGGCVLAI